MNRTHFEHAGCALLKQAAVGLLTGNWLAGRERYKHMTRVVSYWGL